MEVTPSRPPSVARIRRLIHVTCVDEARDEESYFSLAVQGSFTEKGRESWVWKEVRPSQSAGGGEKAKAGRPDSMQRAERGAM